MSKKIYFAGKIKCNDWRHDIVPRLRSGGYWNNKIWDKSNEEEILELEDNNWYVGPFFVSDDHGCGHGDNTHGVGNKDTVCFDAPRRKDVFGKCVEQISNCDYVFCWLDSQDAYGTLFELGVAYEKKKKIFLAVDKKFEDGDFWFLKIGCWQSGYFNNHQEAWIDFLKTINPSFEPKDKEVKQ